jgi:hypothetical protein
MEKTLDTSSGNTDVSSVASQSVQGSVTPRFFIAFYSGIHISGYGQVRGHMDFRCPDGNFLSLSKTIEQIEIKNRNCKDVVLTGILEVSERDWQDWTNSEQEAQGSDTSKAESKDGTL